MRLLVCGSRQWHDRPIIRAALREHQQLAWELGGGREFVVIHGHCPDGADMIADQICLSEIGLVLGETLIRVPAEWSRYGRAAGPVRNARMLHEFSPTHVVGFREGVKSSGTDDMTGRAVKAKLPTLLYTRDGVTRLYP